MAPMRTIGSIDRIPHAWLLCVPVPLLTSVYSQGVLKLWSGGVPTVIRCDLLVFLSESVSFCHGLPIL